MKAIFLTSTGKSSSAFQIRETETPKPKPRELLIKVEASGLNFADIMARKGLYRDAPPLPAVLGYDVAGTVVELGAEVKDFKQGDRIVALCRFGGYAEYVAADERACAIIPAEMSAQIATALSTQYCTAYYAAAEAINLFEGDKVLIHAAAGGVGTALMQYARYKKCEIFATAGTEEKLSRLKAEGAAHTINYRASSFAEEVRAITGNKGIDVVFDALGGKNVKQGIQLLRAGGKMICYGASVMSDAKNPLTKIGAALAFGFYHPAQLMMPCKSIIGVNMLRIADEKPETLSRCLQAVVRLQKEGIFHPLADKTFPYTEIAAAHDFIEQRKNTGKVAIIW